MEEGKGGVSWRREGREVPLAKGMEGEEMDGSALFAAMRVQAASSLPL